MQTRITQKHIAGKLGLHPSTVCLALSNNAMIAEATRATVRKAASELGYYRDPMLSALSAYRRGNTPRSFKGTIGWLGGGPDLPGQAAGGEAGAYFTGAEERARELGYKVECFSPAQYATKARRLLSVWRARRIQGVLVDPRSDGLLRAEISRGSPLPSVSVGGGGAESGLPHVCAHRFANVSEICLRLRQAGYRRIGWLISTGEGAGLGEEAFAAFLVQQQQWPSAERLAPCLASPDQRHHFLAWLGHERPEVFITGQGWLPVLQEIFGSLANCPAGVALVATTRDYPDVAGMNEESLRVGAIAVDHLASLIEGGVEDDEHPEAQHIYVRGTWQPGPSLRERNAGRAGDQRLPAMADDGKRLCG